MLEEGRPGVCIMVDIDFFKKINDTYGHSCGDATLRAFARRLRDGLRPGDLCCRYGGEEFLIFLAGATSPDVGRSVAERLRRAVEQLQIPCDGHDLRVTASFGGQRYRPVAGGCRAPRRRLPLRGQERGEKLCGSRNGVGASTGRAPS